SHTNDSISVNSTNYAFLRKRLIQDINWAQFNIDYVIEATGKIKTVAEAEEHIQSGAKKVILSATADDDNIKTVVLGVNENIITGDEKIVSNASCTTNNAAPMIKIINDLCGIEQAYITTIHSYTTDQSLH